MPVGLDSAGPAPGLFRAPGGVFPQPWLGTGVGEALAADAVLAATATITTAGFLGLSAGATLAATANLTAGGALWGPPHGLIATPISDTQIDLSWSAVAGASGYDIERDGVVIATDVAVTTYSDTGLNPGTTYHYRARSARA